MEDIITRPKSIRSLIGEINKGKYNFDLPIQRRSGIWNRKEISLFVDSILRLYPIYPALLNKHSDTKTLDVVDFKQRFTGLADFANNKFSLSKDLKPIVIDGVEYEIAGKKFKKLDEEVQNTLLACSLEFCTLSEYTDDEVKEMFRRQNTSKPLNGKLLRIVHESDDFSDVVYSLATHPFMSKIVTPTQKKSGVDRDLIIQTLMLASTNQENDFTSFRTKDIDAFVKNYADASIEKADILKETMDKFDAAYDEIKIPITSIPVILYAGYRVTKDKKSFSKLVEAITEFLNNYDSNEEYKKFTQSGTSSSENVRGRFDYWRNIIKEL